MIICDCSRSMKDYPNYTEEQSGQASVLTWKLSVGSWKFSAWVFLFEMPERIRLKKEKGNR